MLTFLSSWLSSFSKGRCLGPHDGRSPCYARPLCNQKIPSHKNIKSFFVITQPMHYVRPAGRASSSFAFVHVAKCSRLVVPLRSSLGICPSERAYHSTSVRLRQIERPTRLSTFSHDDTIYAVSTGSGRAGIAIVRISGHSCLEVEKVRLSYQSRLLTEN